MPSSETLEVVPCFDDVQQLRAGFNAKKEFAPIDLYPRDGTHKLSNTESQMAYLARVEQDELALFNTGMSAVKTAIEVALDQTANDQTPVLAHSRQLYSQTTNFINRYLQRRGVKLVTFDSSCPASVGRTINNYQPNVVVAETIGNSPDVPVLDSQSLRENISQYSPKSITILDNTLPLATALPIGEQLSENEQIIVVESGTKAYTFNTELSGLVYSKNDLLLHAIRQYRRTTGTMPGLASLDSIQSLLPETREAFDERNRRIFATTGAIALSLYQAEQQGADFIVSHPSLATHNNQAYYLDSYKDGAAPLLYLQCTGQADQFSLAQRLMDSPNVREQADLGQSFGFDRTRILPDEYCPVVRISGGAYTDHEQLGKALIEAALSNN